MLNIQLQKIIDSISIELEKLKELKIILEESSKTKIIDLINSELWPNSVPPDLICDKDSEDDKNTRAISIVSTYLNPKNLKDKKFLDFGCGEGHIVKQSTLHTNLSVGFDLICQEEKTDKFIITSNFEQLKTLAPFDTILLYDVLDHSDDPIDILYKVKELSSIDTNIFIRFHPWCSRHGSHTYRELNKAFAHLILNETEFASLVKDVSGIPKQKVLFPINTYKSWIQTADLKIIDQPSIIRENMENFFVENSDFAARLIGLIESVTTKTSMNSYKEFPKFQLEQSFMDFIIKI